MCAWQGEHGSLPRHLHAAGITPRSRVRGPGHGELQSGGLQKRAYGVCVREPTPGQMPHRPARGTRDSAALRRPMLGSPGLLSSAPGQGRAPRPPCTRESWLLFPSRRCGPGRGNIRARHRPPSSLPQRRAGPGEPDRRTAAAAAKETFSPEQPGSSTLRQLSLRASSLLFSKQAPRRSRDARLLGDWARVPHMEAPLLEPLGLECLAALTQPDLLGAQWALPCRDRPPTFPAVSFCPEHILTALPESAARVVN